MITFCVIGLTAQNEEVFTKRPLQKTTVKLSITSFLEYPPVFEPGVEFRLGPQSSLNMHVGATGINYGPDIGAWFVRSKNEFRFYINEFGNKEQNLCFIGIEGTYRYQKETRTEWLSRFGGAFLQEYKFNRFRNVASLFVNYGWQSKGTNSRFVTDYKIGIGYRFHKLTQNIPDDVEGNFRVIIPSVVNNVGSYTYPMINFIIAGGYIAKQ